MRKIRDISEDEMIVVFLQTELNSTRFRQDIEAYAWQERIDPRMLHVPDWRDARKTRSGERSWGCISGMVRGNFFTQKTLTMALDPLKLASESPH